MHIEATEVLWFEQHVLSLSELAELSGLPTTMLEELLDCGAIAPLEPGMREIRFGASALRIARSARRLQADFELDLQGLALALRLLERVTELEAQMRALRARLPQQGPSAP
jgi:chaperone modulatory protein CbpM